jgi:hypothetical protein
LVGHPVFLSIYNTVVYSNTGHVVACKCASISWQLQARNCWQAARSRQFVQSRRKTLEKEMEGIWTCIQPAPTWTTNEYTVVAIFNGDRRCKVQEGQKWVLNLNSNIFCQSTLSRPKNSIPMDWLVRIKFKNS